MSGPEIVPVRIGSVPSLQGVRLSAAASLDEGARGIRSFVIDIAHRATPADVVFRHAGEEVKTPRRLSFMTLAGRTAKPRGMRTDHQKPVVHLQSTVPMEAYSWRLFQNGRIVQEVPETTDGISADNRCITLQPKKPLLRNGRLPEGYFFPPFSIIEKPPRAYIGVTYGKSDDHDEHSSFSVDFNRGKGGKDRGDPVLAVQGGRVIKVDRSEEGKGTVWIRHRGDYMTHYTHMTDIPDELGRDRDESKGPQEKAIPPVTVTLLQQVGKIGEVGAPGQVHLHHRHYHGKVGGVWQPTQMTFGGEEYKTSRESVPAGKVIDLDERLMGWTLDRAAILGVTARLPGGAKIARRIRFRVAAENSIPSGNVPDCVAGPVSVPLELVFQGALTPGEYVIRYQATDDRGETGPVAIDDSVVITGP